MTIEELYQVFDNVNRWTKFYIISGGGDTLEWGSLYQDIPDEVRSMPIEYIKYNDGEITIWVP